MTTKTETLAGVSRTRNSGVRLRHKATCADRDLLAVWDAVPSAARALTRGRHASELTEAGVPRRSLWSVTLSRETGFTAGCGIASGTCEDTQPALPR